VHCSAEFLKLLCVSVCYLYVYMHVFLKIQGFVVMTVIRKKAYLKIYIFNFCLELFHLNSAWSFLSGSYFSFNDI